MSNPTPNPSPSGQGNSSPKSPSGEGSRPAAKGVTISDSAVAKIQKLLADRGTPSTGLRVQVKGGGCSGLQYDMSWAEQPKERDKIFERDGVRVFVDPKSYLYLVGTILDYQETLMESGFKLVNPNAKTTCGCGQSFTA